MSNESRLLHSSAKWKEIQHLQSTGVHVHKILVVMKSTLTFAMCRLHVLTTPVQQPMMLEKIQKPQFLVRYYVVTGQLEMTSQQLKKGLSCPPKRDPVVDCNVVTYCVPYLQCSLKWVLFDW